MVDKDLEEEYTYIYTYIRRIENTVGYVIVKERTKEKIEKLKVKNKAGENFFKILHTVSQNFYIKFRTFHTFCIIL